MRAIRPAAGFTLIELLVVVAIIAVLAGILIPTINLVRVQARTVECAGTQRVGAMGILAYAQDQHGRLPLPRYNTTIETVKLDFDNRPAAQQGTPLYYTDDQSKWFNVVHPYLDSLALPTDTYWNMHWNTCKGAVDPIFDEGAVTFTEYNGNFWTETGLGYYWDGLPSHAAMASAPYPMSRATAPGETVLLADGFTYDWYHSKFVDGAADKSQPAYFFWFIGENGAPGYDYHIVQMGKHSGKANYAFLDGHIETLSKAEAAARAGASAPNSKCGYDYSGTAKYFVKPN